MSVCLADTMAYPESERVEAGGELVFYCFDGQKEIFKFLPVEIKTMPRPGIEPGTFRSSV